MPFQREVHEQFQHGSVLVSAPDGLVDGALRLLKNARLDREVFSIASRPGISLKTTTAIVASGIVRALSKLYGATTDFSYAHVNSTLYRLTDAWASATSLSTLAGTTPLTSASMADGEGGIHRYFVNGALPNGKDDGTTFRTAGIVAPSAAPSAIALAADLTTAIDAMEASGNWTVTAGLSAGPTNEANIKIEGTNSQTITIAASTLGSIAKSMGGTTDLEVLSGGDSDVQDDDYIYLEVRADFPERVSYVLLEFDLDTTTVANAFRTNVYSAYLPGSIWLNQGANQWSTLQVSKSSFSRAGTDAAKTWADVESIRISFQINSEGSCQLYLDDYKLRGGTDVVGQVQYTAVYEAGTTGGRGNPPQDSELDVVWTSKLAVDRQRVTVTTSNIDAPSDTQIDTIQLFRRIDEDIGYRIATFADTTTTYTDGITQLAALLSPIVLETDNDVPPTGSAVFGPGSFNRLFMLDGLGGLRYSKSWEINENRAENWPLGNQALFGDGQQAGIAGIGTDTEVYVGSVEQMFRIQGQGDAILPVAIPDSVGLVGTQAITQGDGRIFLASQDGIYEQIGTLQRRITDGIAPFFAGITVEGQLGWNTDASALRTVQLIWKADYRGFLLVMAYPDAGSTTPNKHLTLKKHPLTGQYTIVSFDSTAVPFQSLLFDDEDNELLAGGTDGHVYLVEDHGVNTDNGTGIAFDVLTKAYHQGAPHLQKRYSDVAVEGNTNDGIVTVVAQYDKNATTETLGTLRTSADVARGRFTIDSSLTERHDISLRFTATVSVQVTIPRFDFGFELQPERVLFFDTGQISFGKIIHLHRLVVNLIMEASVDVAIYWDGAATATDTPSIPFTSGQRPITLFLPGGRKGRVLRVTLASTLGFGIYGIQGYIKALNSNEGYQPLTLGQAA